MYLRTVRGVTEEYSKKTVESLMGLHVCMLGSNPVILGSL